MFDLLTDDIIDYLAQLRTGPTKIVKRGKKLNISAGKSIGTSDLLLAESKRTSQNTKTKRQIWEATDSESEEEHGQDKNKNITDIMQNYLPGVQNFESLP